MKLSIIPTLILALVFALSCSSPTDNHGAKKVEQTEDKHQDEASTVTELRLNNGAKWSSDESTFSGMKRLEISLFNFEEKNSNPTVENYNSLGDALANIDKDIISQCKMQGKDHDQLHILLAPMLANVDVIKNDSNKMTISENKIALNKSVQIFFEYFEVK